MSDHYPAPEREDDDLLLNELQPSEEAFARLKDRLKFLEAKVERLERTLKLLSPQVQPRAYDRGVEL